MSTIAEELTVPSRQTLEIGLKIDLPHLPGFCRP